MPETDPNINPFGITREEILNLAAQKLADDCTGDSLWDIAKREIKERIDTYVNDTMKSKIDAVLSEEMEKILSSEIAPVNIWGEAVGTPTTIRAALAQKARDFWNVTVNEKGAPSDSWGSKMTKAEWLMKKITGEEFSKAVQQNLTNIVGAFKDALKEQAQKDITEHLNKILVVKSLKD